MTPHDWLARVRHAADTLPHGERPTELHVRIAAKLAYWRDRTPTHRRLARAARCSRRTVVNALARLRDLGLLSWANRTLCGSGVAVRLSNAYVFSAATGLESIRILTRAKFAHPRDREAPPAPDRGECAAALEAVRRRRAEVLWVAP